MGFMDEFYKALQADSPKSGSQGSGGSGGGSSFMDEYNKAIASDNGYRIVPNVFQNTVRTYEAPLYQQITSGMTVSHKKKEEEEKPWYKSGLFEDGYQVGDISKTILGIKEDTASIKDLTVGSFKRGFYNSRLGEESFKAMNGGKNDKEYFQKLLESEEYQFTPGSDFASGVSGAFELGGQMLRQFSNPRTLAFTGAAAGAAAIAGQAGPQVLLPEEIITVPAAASAAFAAGSAASNLEIEAGHAYNEMLEHGIKEDTAKKVALAVGTVNAGLEMLQVDELLDAYKVTKASGATQTFTKRILDELVERGVDVAKETGQEVLQEGVTIAGVQAASLKDKGEAAYTAQEERERLIDTAKSSALSFGVMNVPAAVKNTVSIATEQKNANKLSTNEQAVVDKVYNDRVAEAEKNGEVSKSEKKKIYDQVVAEMDRGYLSVEDIESALGGKTYEDYKSVSEMEDSLQKEYDELHAMKRGEMTGQQIDREAELKKQLEEAKTTGKRDALKQQLSESVFGLAKGMYAPYEPVKPLEKATPDTMDAPVYESKEPGAVRGQTTMFAPEKPKHTSGKVAQVLTEEAKAEKKKSGLGSKVVSQLVDKGAAVEKLSLETGNHELQAKFQAALPSTTESKAQYFMENGAEGVKPLKSIREEVDSTGKTEAFFDYLYHLHNADRMSLDVRFGLENIPVFGDSVTAEQSRQKAANYEKHNPKFKAFAEDVYAYFKHLKKEMVKEGVISQEYSDWLDVKYPHYVPTRRVDQQGAAINVPLDTNKTGVNTPIKRATGGNSNIQPLWGTMAIRAQQTYRAIARNSFGLELKNTLNSAIETEANENGVLPAGTIVKAHDRSNFGKITSYNEATGKYSVYFVSPTGKKATVQLDGKTLQVIKQPKITEAGEMIDTIEMQDDLLKPGTTVNNPTFTVFENGERVEFEITEDLYDSLKPAGELLGHRFENSDKKVVRGIGKALEGRRNLLTTWNPVFALYRNPIKDAQEVMINSQHPLRTYANVPHAVLQLLSDTKAAKKIFGSDVVGKYVTEYHKNGGKSNTYFDSRRNEFVPEDSVFKKVVGMPLKAIETAGEFIEEIPRLAEYIASRQDGRSVERSMLDAARVTTNFAAGGDFTKFLNSHGFTFLNASVQGAAQHVRNFREAKQQGLKGYVKVLAKYTISGLGGVLLNNLLWGDDEEYEELNDYVKQNYYVVAKTEDGKFIRIPKGRTAAVMQNAFEQMEHLITGDDEADFSTFYELFMNNIAPSNPLENNILAPIGQVIKNEAWYGGDLVPSRLQKLPKEEQFDESTDAFSKWLGETTGTSPYKWNYLIDQYSGGLGDVFLPMLTPEAESGDNSFMGNMIAPWKKEITTDSVLNNKNPGEFYELRDELEVKSNGRNATEEDKMKTVYLDSVSWEMSDLYAKKREIQNSDLPDDEKYEAVRETQEEINELARNALNQYDRVSVDGAYSEVGDRRYNYDVEKDKWYEIRAKNSDGSDNWYYIQEQLSHDKLGMSYADFWNGEKPSSADMTYYAEYNGKRYNYDAEKGQWYEIREKNEDGSDNWYYQTEQEVTKGLGISYEEYWSKPKEYQFAYEKPGHYALSKAVGGYETYKEHYDVLHNSWSDNYLRSDKDSNGNSISGSRKDKVIDYINDLDMDYGERIILYRSVYSSKADKRAYNQDIIDYLNERDDISYEDMKAILEELDFNVDSEGYITW